MAYEMTTSTPEHKNETKLSTRIMDMKFMQPVNKMREDVMHRVHKISHEQGWSLPASSTIKREPRLRQCVEYSDLYSKPARGRQTWSKQAAHNFETNEEFSIDEKLKQTRSKVLNINTHRIMKSPNRHTRPKKNFRKVF